MGSGANHGIWVMVNSFDEIFHMADDGVTFTCLQGHYSMGGIDIYRLSTILIQSRSTPKTWASVEFSLRWFSFVPDENNEKATFVTARNTLADSLEVALMEMGKNPIHRPYDKISRWGVLLELKEEPKKICPSGLGSWFGTTQTCNFNAVGTIPNTQGLWHRVFYRWADSLRVWMHCAMVWIC